MQTAGGLNCPTTCKPFNSRPATGSLLATRDLDPKNPRRLLGEPGHGVLLNSKESGTKDLFTRAGWGDLEVTLDFMVPKDSNSGIKLQGAYEIQIRDSQNATKLTGADCGGIYPRAENDPGNYHYLDKGVPPRVNACKAAGEWQTLEIVFRAPRFDGNHHKVANARFEKVVLNGKVIHENVEVKYPTGHYWHNAEHALAPLQLQGDHGPVAFRNIRVRPLPAASASASR